jgi:hypothetical protein
MKAGLDRAEVTDGDHDPRRAGDEAFLNSEPTIGIRLGSGGHRPEPELDRLSTIIRAVNDRFGTISWPDRDHVRRVLAGIPTCRSRRCVPKFPEEPGKRSAGVEYDGAVQRVTDAIMTTRTSPESAAITRPSRGGSRTRSSGWHTKPGVPRNRHPSKPPTDR